MNARQKLISALAGLGLVIAVPVQAAPNFMDGAIIVAKRDRADEVRQDPRDTRRDERRAAPRETVREERDGYGYGYERRQQQRLEEDHRPRDRR